MKIKSIAVSNFRGYEARIHVSVNNLTALIGRNDQGKSTILEALDIFFNEGKGCVKIDKGDINKACLERGEDCIQIEVEFTDLPADLVIDSTNRTTLEAEYLLTSAGTLHVIKRYQGGKSERVFIRANHPINQTCSDLHKKKISELRNIADQLGLACDRGRCATLRHAIWASQTDLQLSECDIAVSGIDEKDIWEQLKSHMPLFTLFQSDRKNTDADEEVQDPMRIAVKEILNDDGIQRSLAEVAEVVKRRLSDVSDRTLEKLNELNPAIANSLSPRLPDTTDLKWADVFKSVSISGDNSIPINKRGSGVKRLVLISFFRAEAERRQAERSLPHIIYAIEEPETSQHPEHQRALADALIQLAGAPNTQVLLTTHSPEIVKRLKFENLLLVSGSDDARVVSIREHELPYPSLNEVNYVAFGEATEEYHNELYGWIEENDRLIEFKAGRPTRQYNRSRNGNVISEQKILTEYIRHQIHHPENRQNPRYTPAELAESIESMRVFLSS